MSGKEMPANGNVPHIPGGHIEDDTESMGSGNEEQAAEQQEAELQEIERRPLETGSLDSGLDSPLDFGGSLDSGHDSPLEGAVGGELEASDVEITSQERSRMEPGKEDLFRKFFSKEYDQPNALILGRRRNPDQRLENFNINPLRSLQDVGMPLEETLDKTEAISGQNFPVENIQGCPRFGTENGRSLPSMRNREDLDCSVKSGRNVVTDSRPSSDESRRLSPESSSMSISSRQTASTDNMQISPLLYSDSPEENSEDTEKEAQEKPVRRRRIGVFDQPMPVRSQSTFAGSSSGIAPDTREECHKKKLSKTMSVCSEPLRKVSEAMSVCSEPLLGRKISKDSSVDSYEPMSLEDDPINYPELSHSLESEPCLPTPDLDPEAIENFAALTTSSAVAMDDTEQNVKESEEIDREQNATDLNDSHDAKSNKPQSDSSDQLE